ncbi:MAG: 3-phosphoshikimate 1-carboxyvinyltransferase [Tindallia sp. MSAO_Bac2]|nr:MAG: 3-phosphoshikimate 1-carboxyvinyltransferase [Tindallia sp. MSAO_Bac2]
MLTVHNVNKLRGTCRVPGDKSISHRAVMLAGISEGQTTINGFLKGEDCLSTIRCFEQMGVRIREENNQLVVTGNGLYGLKEPEDVLDAGNSGTTMRLMAGILSGQAFHTVITGDESLRKRPMKRIAAPLREMGASIDGRMEGTKAPLAIRGSKLKGIRYKMPVASAQIKSAILLAGLYAEEKTSVIEPRASRDHTERMLESFGVSVKSDGLTKTVQPGKLKGTHIEVPGDISSAAFLLVAAACLKGSDVTLENVGINPTRAGIIEVLQQMGAEISVLNQREVGGEPIADLNVKGTSLKAVDIGEDLIPSLIDEVPVLAIAAACARGKTSITGAAELRVKETDRISAMAEELKNIGVEVTTLEDGMVISGPQPIKGGKTNSHGDHRIAMAMAVAGLMSENPVEISNETCMAVSFPGFMDVIDSLIDK